jgi:hypothetical protein
MTAVDVASALATRRTIRITYSRGLDAHRVEIAIGDLAESFVAQVRGDEGELAECIANAIATDCNLDVTRVDGP